LQVFYHYSCMDIEIDEANARRWCEKGFPNVFCPIGRHDWQAFATTRCSCPRAVIRPSRKQDRASDAQSSRRNAIGQRLLVLPFCEAYTCLAIDFCTEVASGVVVALLDVMMRIIEVAKPDYLMRHAFQ